MSEKHAENAFSMPKAADATQEKKSLDFFEYWLTNAWKPTFYMYEPWVHELKKIFPWLPVPETLKE